ncbi:MAG: hypothetical protein ABJC33_03020 [Betaproteobacteria bacterium]
MNELSPQDVSAYTVAIELHLRYAHGLGALSPYFAGLERGVALATQCPRCRRTWFAPRLTCICGSRVLDWRELTGRGTVVVLTRGPAVLPVTGVVHESGFALIRLDGADNLCFGRLGRTATQLEPGNAVRLARAPGQWAHPSQCAEYVPAGALPDQVPYPLASLSDQS